MSTFGIDPHPQPNYRDRFPKSGPQAVLVFDWTRAAVESTSWAARAARFDELARDLIHQQAEHISAVRLVRTLITAALEHLEEAEIGSFDAAHLYALSWHPNWCRAAERYLVSEQPTEKYYWCIRHPRLGGI